MISCWTKQKARNRRLHVLINEDPVLECKGLGESKENASIKALLRKYKADIIMFQETKRLSFDWR